MWRIWYSRQTTFEGHPVSEHESALVEADDFEAAAAQVPEGWRFIDAEPIGIELIA